MRKALNVNMDEQTIPVHSQTGHCRWATCTPSSQSALLKKKKTLHTSDTSCIHKPHWIPPNDRPFPPLQWMEITFLESAAIHSLTQAVYRSISLTGLITNRAPIKPQTLLKIHILMLSWGESTLTQESARYGHLSLHAPLYSERTLDRNPSHLKRCQISHIFYHSF